MAKRLLSVLLVLGLGLVAACGGGSTDSGSVELSKDEAAAYTKAQKEPALVWYSSQDPERNEAVIEAFTRKYPKLEVTSQRLSSGQLATRYSQERRAGAVNAGLVTLAVPDFVARGHEAGWFQTFDKTEFPELAALPAKFFKKGVATTGINVFGIGYNTDLVKEPPKNWPEILGPRYRGQIIFGDPRNVPSYMALAHIWLKEYGPDFLRKLATQRLTVVGSMVPGTQQLAAGEGAVGLPSVLTTLQPVIEQGAPVKLTVPQVTTGNEFTTMISTDSESPVAARLLYQFLLTKEGQRAFNGKTGASPLGVAGTAPLPKNYVPPQVSELSETKKGRIVTLLGLAG